ncbi:MAG: hypothetical protein M3324_11965 [Actinomycetota bacterium]|nr:hypothetical protein [Actinomycetota bacterium]
MEQIKILTARRAYEFRPDDLRLSVLSVAQVYQQIQQFFGFGVAVVATPQQMFGPVPNTIPPGLVFDYGATQTPEELPTPIRFLHFEPRRIVVDVAGPSSAIDWTFEQLQRVLAEIRAPDGSPSIGEPERMRDYSEISAHYDFDFGVMVGGPLLELARRTTNEEGHSAIPLSIRFRAVDPAEEVHPAEVGQPSLSQGQMFEIRAGTRPKDRTFFSAAELTTDQHLAWLESLEAVMDSGRAR